MTLWEKLRETDRQDRSARIQAIAIIAAGVAASDQDGGMPAEDAAGFAMAIYQNIVERLNAEVKP